MERPIFTKFTFNDGRKVVVNEINGYDMFMAGCLSKGNPGEYPYQLMLIAVTIDGKPMSGPEDLANLSAEQCLEIMTNISVQLEKAPK